MSAATFSAAPRPPSAPAAAAVDEPPPPRGSEQASAAYFAAFAPAEIEAERPFDLSVRAFIAAMQAEVVREERAHHNELMGEMHASTVEPVQRVELTLEVNAVTTVLQFYQACADQLSVGATNLNGLSDMLQYAGQKADFDVDRDTFQAVRLRVIGFARCKPFLREGSSRLGNDFENILRAGRIEHLTVQFDN